MNDNPFPLGRRIRQAAFGTSTERLLSLHAMQLRSDGVHPHEVQHTYSGLVRTLADIRGLPQTTGIVNNN